MFYASMAHWLVRGGRLLHGDDLEPQAVILSLQEAWFSWKINASMWSVLLHGIIGVALE